MQQMCSQRKGHHKNLRNNAQMLQFKALEVATERGFSADVFTALYHGGRAPCGGIDCLFVFIRAKDRPRGGCEV
ncbi:Hypothetical protein PHPALM_17164 [Phytophthora palmivora]|uniref:Uncharacterized protein n=1 Tax=Phytophthora palmivora TaxID=4796 RepID=A0A2P4XMW3_9STRA|nr:Hypothetical protein PHPALM_17164 [Phytophthora palmivora]